MTSDFGIAGGGADRGAEVAGFWRRTAAFCIDCLVLGLIGLVLAVLFFDQLAEIGQWGRLIGFFIGAGYFAVMEGYAGRCQSLGKKALKIKVVRCEAHGISTLNMTQAGVRYAIIAIPTLLGGIGFVDIPALNSPSLAWLSNANSLAVFLWGTALLYLLIFNRPSRQSLHDLAVRSLVVRDSASEVRVAPLRALHWAVLGGFAAILVIASPFINRYAASKLAGLYAVQRAALSIPGVRQISVTASSNWHVGSSGQVPRTSTMIAVVAGDPALLTEHGALAVAKAAFGASPMLANQDIVTIVCVRAVDLGIATWRKQFVESWTGSQWVSKIGLQPAVSNR